MKRFQIMNIFCLIAAVLSTQVPLQAFGQSQISGIPQPGVVKNQFIYLKAPFPECHASTIAQSGDSLVAAWFGGTYEKHPDVGIWVSIYKDRKWSTPREVATGVQHSTLRYPTWNPVLYQPTDGPLLLFYKVGPSPSTWWGMLTTSTDGGNSWSFPYRLPEGIAGPIKNQPVLLADGTLLCGSSSEDHGWRVHLEMTRDLGKTWERTGPLNDGKTMHAIQPTILQHSDGKLQILCRSKNGFIVQAWSEDQGKTWTKMESIDLPNPNSGFHAVTLRDGRHLLVYNHTKRGRSPLNVAVSKDGIHWQAAAILEDQPGEYSYPAVMQAADGLVHITYTWRRRRLKHVVIDPEKLMLRSIQN